MYLNPKLSKYITLLPIIYKAIQWVPTDFYSPRFITYAPFFALGKWFQQRPLNLGLFWYLRISKFA